MKEFESDLMKAAVSGLVGVAGGYFIMNEAGSVQLFGLSVPTAAAIGASVAAGSLISDVAHDWLLPYINKNKKLTNIESALLQIAASGLGTSAVLIYGCNAPISNLPNMVLLGAGSAIGGDWINSKFISGKSNLLF